MRVLSPDFSWDAFWESVRGAPTRVLALDYDGTLAPFKVERHEAAPYPGVVEALERMVAQGATRLVIVSGRDAEDVRQLLGMAQPVEIWGAHGGERLLPDGEMTIAALEPRDVLGLGAVESLALDLGMGPQIEKKRLSLALHWRGLPELTVKNMVQRLQDASEIILQHTGLTWRTFDGGMELRPPGVTKADAVRAILSEVADDAALAYLGDDLTDEDAFRALGDRGLSVLVRPRFRKTAAHVHLTPPKELIGFLNDWAAAVGG
jgi:trehalose-phosphatase